MKQKTWLFPKEEKISWCWTACKASHLIHFLLIILLFLTQCLLSIFEQCLERNFTYFPKNISKSLLSLVILLTHDCKFLVKKLYYLKNYIYFCFSFCSWSYCSDEVKQALISLQQISLHHYLWWPKVGPCFPVFPISTIFIR